MRRAKRLFAPAIVLTGHQIAGRGRGGNSWWSKPGVITVTFAFPIDDRFAPHQVPLLAGIAVRSAIVETIGDHHVQLKWPNDLLREGRKLAGLLCERVEKVDLIGLGLNVNVRASDAPKTIRDRVTSLSDVVGHEIDQTQLLVTIAKHLRLLLTRRDEHPFGVLLREYDSHHALIGKLVTVIATDGALHGKCEGLDSQGRLLLRDRRTLHRVIAGEVRVQ